MIDFLLNSPNPNIDLTSSNLGTVKARSLHGISHFDNESQKKVTASSPN
jgi:hypothetical protein